MKDFIHFVLPGLPERKEKELAREILANIPFLSGYNTAHGEEVWHQDTDTIDLTTVKHLPGKHEQKKHGNRYGGSISISGEFHPETAKTINQVASSISKEYNINVKGIVSENGEIEYTMEYDFENETIKMTEFLAKFSPDVLDQYASQAQKYNGGASRIFKEMVIHEMGHAIKDTIRGRLLKKDEAINNKFFDELDLLVKNNPSPSRYGETNRSEWLSERFVLEMRGDVPKLLIPIFAKYSTY